MDLDDAFGLIPGSPPPPVRWPRPPAEEVIPELVDAIVHQFRPVRIILFGSRARGDHRPTSDVDLLVVLDEVDDKRAAAARIRDEVAAIPVAKDIIATTPAEIEEEGAIIGAILYPALQDGVVLYERNNPPQGRGLAAQEFPRSAR